MNRQYLAFWDDGHDFGEFTYYSEYRNNSKFNRKDAELEKKHKYGYKRADQLTIIQTQRCYDNE